MFFVWCHTAALHVLNTDDLPCDTAAQVNQDPATPANKWLRGDINVDVKTCFI